MAHTRKHRREQRLSGETKKNKLQWLKEAQEECLDMAMYLEKCIEDESNVSWEGEDIKIKELNESYGGTI